MLRDLEIVMLISVITSVATVFLNFGIASLSTLNITFMHCKKAVRVNIASIHKQHMKNLPHTMRLTGFSTAFKRKLLLAISSHHLCTLHQALCCLQFRKI
ncbi:hypothetical protein CRT38_03477 [Anaplasma phagocytophilum str. CRT38]|uniref:Uncharacterized protein n=1 Tax=Anaplasma phagocytophilum str. CRT38 TaxID=1269275 RepID=S6GAK7_ANAPH|nr:hypothetical protein CRT38_03477 [Anaplasma phagocytophilum str. CRT38]